MQGSFSRRGILDPSELRALNARSDLMGTLQMASHLLAIAGAAWLHALALGSWWVLPSGFLLGVLVNFLYAAQHELSHSTVFRTRGLNELFGRAIGFIQLFPRDFDQIMHFAHHQWTQDWKRDGELVREPYTLGSYLLWVFGVTYWRNRAWGTCRHAAGIVHEPYVRKEEEAKVVLEARLHLAGYAFILVVSVIVGSWEALTFWILPMILTKPVHQLQNTIEHLGLTHENDVIENTRSTRTNALLRWLCWQMPYHTAHHTFPSVPFWSLRKLNEKLERKVGPVHQIGYLEFQFEVVRKLARKDESQYPMNEVWIVPRTGGRDIRIPID